MKVSVPCMGKGGIDDTVSQHFGKAPAYTVFDTETGEYLFISNTSEHGGGTGLPTDLLAEAGVNIMLCGGIGKGAAVMFQQAGIDVFIGASGTVKDVLDAWKSGNLVKSGQEGNCNSHEHEHGSSCQCSCQSRISIN